MLDKKGLFELKDVKNQKVKIFIKRVIKELNKFYGFKLDYLRVFLVDSRKQIDILRNKKTPDWNCGWTEYKSIFILKEDKFDSESCHRKKDFWNTLKHEIAHLYFYEITNNDSPIWVSEGIAVMLSGQKKSEDLKSAIKVIRYFDKHEKEVYNNGGLIISVLYKKYGKNKLVKLIKSINVKTSNKEFSKNFRKIYGFPLSENSLLENLKNGNKEN